MRKDIANRRLQMLVPRMRRPRIYHNSLLNNKLSINSQRNAALSVKTFYKGRKAGDMHILEAREAREAFSDGF